MTADWSELAAAGTDPEALARVVALSGDPAGRASVAAALDDDGHLLDRTTLLSAALLPAPTANQEAVAATAAAAWRRLGVRVVLRGDPAWPRRLDRLDVPPAWLAVRGDPAALDRPAVAVVGARRATPYGTGVGAWLAEAAADAGCAVVSGGAVGIDAAAHDAAAASGTVVVLGCGHDVAYPRPHARRGGLFDRVLAGGGTIVGELLPGERPRPHNVRARNRIVAGLVDVVVVVEGGATSGSLVTATDAVDAGVEVLAVPGDVRAPNSAAPHRLLREGATPCTGPADLLAALAVEARARRPERADGGSDPTPSVLPPAVAGVLAAAWPRPLRSAQVADRAGLPIGTVLAAVTRGRVAGVLVEGADGIRLARAPGP